MGQNSKFTFKNIITAVGFIIGFIGSALGIYGYFYPTKVADLQYQITSNTNVLDVKAQVSNLDIMFRGESLKKTNSNLKIITIKVVNIGTESIIIDYYDDNELLGIRLDTGRIIEVPAILYTSNQYLRNNLKVNQDTPNTIYFSKVILDPGDYFVVKLVVIHDTNYQPKPIVLGKLANIKEIKIVETTSNLDKRSVYEKLFSGSIVVQLLRFITYTIIGIVLVVVIIIFGEKVYSFKERRKRVALVNAYKQNSRIFNGLDEIIFETYIKNGEWWIWRYDSLLSDKEELSKLFFEYKKDNDLKNHSSKRQYLPPIYRDVFETIINMGILTMEGEHIKTNQHMESTLKDFSNFLEANIKK
jgi:hypothetical protein